MTGRLGSVRGGTLGEVEPPENNDSRFHRVV